MATKKELKALITLAGKIDPSLAKALQSASKMSKNTQQAMEKGAKAGATAYNNLGGVISKVAKIAAGAAIIKGMIEIGKQGVALASDLNEVQNVVDTTFQANADSINAWSKTALKQYGLNELSAKKFTSTMGAMLKSSGLSSEKLLTMAQSLSGLSGDFASFYNLDPEEAFEKIRSGISGEAEPLKQLGINMSAANLEAYALAQGIKVPYEKMDEASKIILRHNYLLSVTKDAQGDFSKTSGSFANQQKLLKESFNQTIATLAQKLLPTLTEIMTKANAFLQSDTMAKIMVSAETGIQKAIDFLGKLYSTGKKVVSFIIEHQNVFKPIAVGIGALAAIVMVLSTVLSIATAVTTAFSFVMAILSSPITLIVLGIAAIIAAGYLLIKNWDAIASFFTNIWRNHLLPVFQAIGSFFTGLWDGIKQGFKGFINFLIRGLNFYIKGMNLLSFDVPDWVPLIGGKKWGFNIPEIPLLAKGGRITNTGTAIVGEKGPELLKLPRGAEVYSNAVYQKSMDSYRSMEKYAGTERQTGFTPGSTPKAGADFKKSEGTGNTYVFNYSPVIQSESGNEKAQLENVLKLDRDRFEERMRQFLQDRERVSFSV